MYLSESVREKELIEQIEFLSPYMDNNFYTVMYENKTGSIMTPAEHYCRVGWMKYYDPHPLFSSSGYFSINSDIKAAWVNPFYHAMKWGVGEGRHYQMSDQRFLYWILTAPRAA